MKKLIYKIILNSTIQNGIYCAIIQKANTRYSVLKRTEEKSKKWE